MQTEGIKIDLDEVSFVTIEKVAEQFSVSVSTIRSWVKSGHIPKESYIKIGATYRYNIPMVAKALVEAPESSASIDADV